MNFESLETQFRTLPPAARQWIGPLFWLHGDESPERLREYVAKVAEGGNGCFTAESRPHRDWLGEGWFRDLGICLEEAKRHGLKMWIFDEKWWPSGEVGGQVPARYGSKRLVATCERVTGPRRFESADWSGDHYIAGVAGRAVDGAVAGETLRDLAPFVRNGRLQWEVPQGEWAVMKFAWTNHLSGSRYLVDGASRDCADWYIRTVYQPHYDRFRASFGKEILGFFYDEPETHGDWGSEVMRVLDERRVDWKRALVAFKFQLAGEEQIAARYQYLDAFAEAWGRTLYGGITRWCEAHGVRSIGHFLEHAGLYLSPELCAGNLMTLQKYSSMGGIDAVFSQFKPGQRAAYDAPCWQTPKLGSSVTHAYGRPRDVTMVEIFGARGQDLGYPEMKWWADHMQVSGVNFLIPHSFNPRAPRDTDCPPYFFNGGFEPRWPLYRVFADYSSRLSLMLTGGRHVAPVAVLFPGQSRQVGHAAMPDDVSEALQDSLYDCDWLPYEVFERDARIDRSELRLREECYRVLVLPGMEVIPYPVLAKVQRFYERGGVVVACGNLPRRSATLGNSANDITTIRNAVWGTETTGLSACRTHASGGRSYLLSEKPTPAQLEAILARDAGIHPTLEVVQGRTDRWLHVLHRVREGRDLFFVANQNHEGAARSFRLRAKASGFPEAWDAMRNDIRAVPFTRQGETAEFDLRLEPNESVLLVFQPTARPLPRLGEPGSTSNPTAIEIVRDAIAAEPTPEPPGDDSPSRRLVGGSWVWFPEGEPATGVPPGTCHFRNSLHLPADRPLKSARFVGTADNHFTLWVNGREAGQGDESGEGWRNPVDLDLRSFLRTGPNVLALRAVNGGSGPNPAGLIGTFTVDFGDGPSQVLRVDASWKAAKEAPANWMAADFDDAGWTKAKVVASYGSVPWGQLKGQLTLSPVRADPFVGHFQCPSRPAPGRRFYLELEGLAPEVAARATVNGKDAGGLIGAPARLEIGRWLEVGRNTIRIEPFAPTRARVVAE